MNAQDVKENIHTMVDQAFAEMAELKKNVARSTGDLRKSFHSEMQSLETKKQELESRMIELRNAASDKREEVLDAVEKSAASFREGLEHMAAVFGKEPMVRK